MSSGLRKLPSKLVRWINHPDEFVAPLQSFLNHRFMLTFRQSKICLISFPKCGRTWLRTIVGKAVYDYYQVERPDLIFYNNTLAVAAGLPPVYISHGDAVLSPKGHPTPAKKSFASKKVILLLRDARDLLVSWYYHQSKRTKTYAGSLSEFIRSETYGAPKLAAFYASWYQSRMVPKEMLLVRYEDLHLKSQEVVMQVMSFIGAGDVPPDIVARAIEFGSFENMQQMERDGRHVAPALQPIGGLADQNALKVRKGKIGSYKDELTAEDLEYIEDTLIRLGAPLEWLYYAGQS